MGRSIGFRCIRPFELRGKEPPDPAYVSSSPSKIPYGGFSPVRLQTGLQPLRSSPTGRRLSDRPTCTRAPASLYAAVRPPLDPCGPCGQYDGAFSQDVPVQRPLARQPVLLSGRVIAYYGLICASRSLPPLYGLCSRPSPYGLLWAGFERVPNLLCLSLPFVPSSVPRRTERLLLAVTSPPTLAFAFLGTGSASTSPPSSVLRWSASRGCKVHFMVRPEEIASPPPTRTFTFELSPPKSPPRDVEYHYAGNSANSRDRTLTVTPRNFLPHRKPLFSN